MADDNKRPMLSVYDRVVLAQTNRTTPEASLSEAETAVMRDIEFLLNETRPAERFGLDRFPELKESILNYGLPDMVSTTLGSPAECERLRRAIQSCLRAQDPRLRSVDVRLATDEEDKTPRLRFRVEATLNLPPTPRRIAFDTLYDLSRRKYQIQG